MKWIKASERLPEFEKDIHAKLEGKNVFGRFYELVGFKRFGVNDKYDLDSKYVGEEHFHLLEWLDESTPPVQEQEEYFNEIGSEAVANKSFTFYPHVLDKLKQYFTITKK